MKGNNRTSCCGTVDPRTEGKSSRNSDPRSEIRRAYAGVAERSSGDTCCGENPVTEQAGYSTEQLQSLPEKARMASAGCGNPTAMAELGPGEVVLDLGSGGGIDVLLAAKRVGPTGKVIGVDMTPEMIDLARENAVKAGATNVEFRLGEIEHLPVADGSIDVIISNCVINLSLEKEKVFEEAYRVLKRGGRMLVSDMMVSGLPDEVRTNVTAWASCIGGAIELEQYVDKIRKAGFAQVEVVSKEEYSEELVKSSMESFLQSLGEEEQKGLEHLSQEVKGRLSVSHADVRATKI